MELQGVDSQEEVLKKELACLSEREELGSLETELTKRKQSYQVIEGKIKENQSRQKRLEDEEALLEGKIKREEDRLYSGRITNPKELSGIEAEVRSLKAKQDQIETQILICLEEGEGLRKESNQLSQSINRLESEAQKVRERLVSRESDLRSRMEELGQKRAELRAVVLEEHLQLYDKLRVERGGLAVAFLLDGVCRGCHMTLPAYRVDKMEDKTAIYRCDFCKRLLVLK
jgi:predicted  nucleic acid-binding Zn-ribbon protein